LPGKDLFSLFSKLRLIYFDQKYLNNTYSQSFLWPIIPWIL
jgi:hypothetical protein